MATHKIPQNVEAEDKLIGPFSFKQFIFLVIAAVGIGLGYLFFRIQPFLVVVPLPVVIVFAILGLYHREDQPVETYLVAALNYYFRNRRRLWDSNDVVEGVRITAPKKLARPKLKQLGTAEHSQLEKLARIVDTHGWSVKRPELNEAVGDHELDTEDRLAVQSTVNRAEALDVHASDDILDPYNNPRAQEFNNLASASTQTARQAAIAKMQSAKAAATPDYLAAGSAPQASSPPADPTFNPYPAMQQKVVKPSNQTQQLAQNNSMTISQLSVQAQKPKNP